ncbi:MAG: alanine racemase [Rikenellaceae bacterium]
MKFSLEHIAQITGATLKGSDSIINRIITDSRSISSCEATLFASINGLNHDGHNYIEAMYNRGVRAFIVEREIDGSFPDAGFVVVDNTIKALQTLAAHYRKEFRGKVVAITGSNAKTVIKEWIAQLCPQETKLFRSPKSYNSQLGVALSLLMIQGDEDIVVIEAGISKPNEMEVLEKIIAPNIVIITNIGDAHQANFTSREQKLEQKLLLAKNASTIIYNSEQSEIVDQINSNFSTAKLIGINKDSYALNLPFADSISKINANIAVSLYDALGFDMQEVIGSSSHLQAVAMRMELKDGTNGALLINDSYNSDINSLEPALDYLCSIATTRKKIVILSDIMQSGIDTKQLYSRVSKMLEDKSIDILIGIGDNICSCQGVFGTETRFYNNTQEFLNSFNREDIKDAAVLIKGSRRFEFEKISHILEHKVHTTVLEVNLDAMIFNLSYFRNKLSPRVGIIAMVKALSYGNGTFEIAKMLEEQGVSMLAVAFADEGVTLRKEGIKMPIVVLNADADSFATMIEYRLEPEIYSFNSLEAFNNEAVRYSEYNYPIHIKLDTGMHRLGFVESQIDELCPRLVANSNLKVSSIFSHFAVSDMPEEHEFTLTQIERFSKMSDQIIDSLPYKDIVRHLSNSAGIEKYPQAQFDAVRLGIGLYGVSFDDQSKLENVSSLKSRIVQIKTLEAGETVGYGRHGKITSRQTIATIPVGYADGLDRRLSRGRWSVNINGSLAPIIGNICMDTCMVDITGIEAKESDTVTIFGESPSILEMAEVLETIPYEIMTSISTRVKRIYIKE